MSDEPSQEQNVRRFKKRYFLVFLAVLIGVALAYAWSQRIAIADRAIADQLDKLDVDAQYEIVEIGPRFQKLRNVVIGDPENPDFTAAEVDIDIKINFAGAVLQTVWVRGGTLNGVLSNGQLSFGVLDKFTSTDSDEAPQLPDLALDIADSKLRLDTEWGRIGIGLVGRGHLQSSFNGYLAAQINELNVANCRSDDVTFNGTVKISNKQPNIVGRLGNMFTACEGLGTVKQASIDIDLNLSEKFDRWRAQTEINIASAQNADARLNNIAAEIDFAGDINRTDAQFALQKTQLFTDAVNIGILKADGEGRISLSDNGYNFASLGQASFAGARLNTETVTQLRSLGSIADNSPLSPLLRQFAPELARSLSAFSGTMQYDVALGDTVNDQNNIILDDIRFASQSGAKVAISNNLRFSKNMARSSSIWQLNSPIGLTISGGKLPSLVATLRQGAGNRWSGEVDMPAYKTANSLLALNKLRFTNNARGGWDFAGAALISGPIPSGRIDGLLLPVDGSWSLNKGISLYDDCQNISFIALQASTLELGKQSLQICPDGNGAIVQTDKDGVLQVSARTDTISLAGLLGDSAINMQSSAVQISLADGLNAKDVGIVIGEDESATLFEMDELTANFSGPIIGGQAINGRGNIGTVPLGANNAQLNWEFADDILSVNGDLMVFDREQVDRFNPLKVPDLLLTLEDGKIAALGQVQEPRTGRKLADVDVKHNLSDARGRALFSVDNLLFNDRLQPDMITNLALGVIANVQGIVDGDGRIEWRGEDVTSVGKFSTQSLDLAAAFGPVSGLSGEIRFKDLINFESEDRQIINLASVNPGIEVVDGRISYQLIAGQKVEIQGGSWPFAGGRLILEPTIWDFAEDVERELAFEVVNMEAAMFLQQFDFDNLTASGIFNGRLPMVFNSEGGRIVGGNLESVSGGNIAYVGDLTYQDLSFLGNFVFNALKSIDYQNLVIGMRGPLDGEIITDVSFSGLQQGASAQKNFITKRIAKIPLKFNVRLEAEFLELFSSVQGYYDPESLVEIYRPDLIRRPIGDKQSENSDTVNENSDINEQPVQPVASKDGL